MTSRLPRSADARPAAPGPLASALERLAGGDPYRAVLEELLRDLEPDDADATMLVLKESRGAWGLLLEAGGGLLLFVGNALSGTVVALASIGFDVLVVDPSPARCALARARAKGEEGRTRFAVGRPEALPCARDSADVVLAELEGGRAASPAVRAGLRRVARGEVAVVVDNRLAYKRSTGHRGRFHGPGPLDWLRRALGARDGERTLPGYRRAVAEIRPHSRAFALYPDSREFSHVVGLGGNGPHLTIGPQERANRIKLAARAVGLFPLLTPSFALVGARAPARSTRLERLLDALAERVGERPDSVEQLVATRSNVAVVHTRGVEGTGSWTVHVPLSATKTRMARHHFETLERLQRDFPDFPAPEPLFQGTVEGVWLTCERRIGGLTAPQVTGDRTRSARMIRSIGRHLAGFVVEPPAPFDEARFERLVAERFRVVRSRCAVDSTARRIDGMIATARERLVGLRFPLVQYHADLRAKHIQVDERGEVLGVLDWGTSEPRFLPYVDLVHLIAHQRKQEHGGRPERSWRALLERSFHNYEQEALEGLAAALDLPGDLRRTVEELYPLFVAGMAERNWDYSRPRWVHEQFGL